MTECQGWKARVLRESLGMGPCAHALVWHWQYYRSKNNVPQDLGPFKNLLTWGGPLGDEGWTLRSGSGSLWGWRTKTGGCPGLRWQYGAPTSYAQPAFTWEQPCALPDCLQLLCYNLSSCNDNSLVGYFPSLINESQLLSTLKLQISFYIGLSNSLSLRTAQTK